MILARCLLVAALLAPNVALAQTKSGCDGLKWPLADERAALAKAGLPAVAGGGALGYGAAATLQLAPLAEAKLDRPPERAPKVEGTYAGKAALAAPPAAGVYKVSVSANAWIDLIDNGGYLTPVAFTGSRDCPGLQRSVKFAFPARPVVLQVSGVKDPTLSLIVTPE